MRCRVASVGQPPASHTLSSASSLKAFKPSASTAVAVCNAIRHYHHANSAMGNISAHCRPSPQRSSSSNNRSGHQRPHAISASVAAAGLTVAVTAAVAASLQHRRPPGGPARLSVVGPVSASVNAAASQPPENPATTAAPTHAEAADAASPAAAASNGASAPPDTAAEVSDSAPANGNGAARAARPADGSSPAGEEKKQVVVATVSSIFDFTAEEWDACATASGDVSPFLLHAFFAALEASGSASTETGWVPCHIALREGAAAGEPETSGRLRAVVPAYIKAHSYGEYVFDHAWANLHHQLGTPYYPKLQCAVPFTPAPGSRMLIAPGEDEESLRTTMLSALPQIAAALKVSSVHMTFNTEPEWRLAGQVGWQSRLGLQYHWENNGYATFDDFLAALKQSKRKSIRQERKSMAKQGLRVERLWGADVTPRIWDAFYDFYTNTTDRKWGQRYLTKDFFVRLGATMADRVMLVVAYDDAYDPDVPIAAALNLVGSSAIVGRNWGCRFGDRYRHLHFELCYYQAIEAAIELGLDRVEAGAQGEHKISRGYLPTPTYSSHYLRDVTAGHHIRRFLRSEAAQMDDTITYLTEAASPFKDQDSVEAQHAAQAMASVRGAADEQRQGTASTDSGDSVDV